MGVFISGGTLYLYCESAQLATDNLILFGDEVFDSNWYELPNEIQKTYILIIANAEKPLKYDGLHMTYLNLPTFSQVRTFDSHSIERFSFELPRYFPHFPGFKVGHELLFNVQNTNRLI